jgi:hypothetical protein
MRDYLYPYSEIFEEVVIPMIRDVSLDKVDKHLARKLHHEIAGYESRKYGRQHHYFLVYYGLMLCCLYTNQDCLEIKDPKQRLAELKLISTARSLICLAYQHKAYHLIPFVV